MAGERRIARVADVADVTDYVANGSFESLRNNVTYRSDPDYAVLVRLVDHNAGWKGEFVYVDKASYDFLRKSALKPGDIVIANVGANAGTVFRVPDLCRPMTLGPNAVLCRSRDEDNLCEDFLYYFLVSKEGQESLRSILSGSAQPKFNKTDFRALTFQVPPISEQRAIAHILDSLDNKIELNRRMNETLEALAQALFKSWFVDFDPVRAKAEGREPGIPSDLAAHFPDSFEDSELGEIPKGWEDAELGQLLEFSKGRKPATKEDHLRNGLSPVILIDTLDTGGSHFALPNGLVVANARDALMVMDGASSGRVETGHEGIVGSTLAKLTPKRERPGARFLYYLLKQFEPQTREHLTGTSIPHADKGWITLLRVALSDDVRLLDRFEGVVGAIRERVEANHKQSRTLASLRDALLPKLLSGQIPLKD